MQQLGIEPATFRGEGQTRYQLRYTRNGAAKISHYIKQYIHSFQQPDFTFMHAMHSISEHFSATSRPSATSLLFLKRRFKILSSILHSLPVLHIFRNETNFSATTQPSATSVLFLEEMFKILSSILRSLSLFHIFPNKTHSSATT